MTLAIARNLEGGYLVTDAKSNFTFTSIPPIFLFTSLMVVLQPNQSF